ncbi:MAG: hypothetical protein L6R38_005919 [Xanthoria sp. 2 TBL-2021]|nr:MAG: hypothetical protein L6R38_005919 [Xanthoria sp. 2 TBL-2021]
MMNTTGNDAVLQIENAGLSLLNFTKITIDYDSENIYTAFTFECFNGTFHDHSLDPQCIRNLRTLLAASECTLSWCINRYSAKQESGTFHENYLDSWQLQHSPEIVNSTASSIEYMRMVPLVEDGNVTILEQNVDRENADYLLTPVPAQDLASYTPCYVEREVHERLGRSLARFFTTSLNYTRGWVPSRADLTTLDPAVVLYGLNKVARGANDLKKDPVSKVFADVAHGLTQYIRQDSTVYQGMHGSLTGGTRLGNGEGNFQATGTTFEDRTIVRVRWGWLAFPVGLVAILVY